MAPRKASHIIQRSPNTLLHQIPQSSTVFVFVFAVIFILHFFADISSLVIFFPLRRTNSWWCRDGERWSGFEDGRRETAHEGQEKEVWKASKWWRWGNYDPFSLGSKRNGAVIQNLNRVRLTIVSNYGLTDSRSPTTRGQTLITFKSNIAMNIC